MSFQLSLENGKARKVQANKQRAESLFLSSVQEVKTAGIIPLKKETSKTILRELYEGIREYCEAIGYLRGFKFLDHESICFFLSNFLGELSISKKFDRYRKLRNGINYYGDDIEIETVKEALLEIPLLLDQLKKHGLENER